MRLWRRCVLSSALAGGLLAGLVTVPVPAAAAAPVAPVPDIVNLCGQNVAPGSFACQAVRATDMAPLTDTPTGYGPADIQSAYALPSATAGSGQTVWIVDAYDNPNAEAELAAYRSYYGLPECSTANGCFDKLNQSGQRGPYPLPNSGWAGEIALDLAMVSATCPNCKIRLIESNDAGTSLFTAIRTAVNLGAKFVSLSWGGSESGMDSYHDRFLNVPGVVFTAASGDAGYADGVIYPSTSPYTVAVGGTSLTGSPGNWTETAWSGAGSGCSSHEAKPPWQAGIASVVCPRRAVADVAAVANPSTGVAVYFNHTWVRFGGTSASAPIIASVYALAGTPGALDRPARYPYEAAGGLRDITSGVTGSCSPTLLCNAAPGWDGPTGLGSPHGVSAFVGNPGSVAVVNPGNRTSTVGAAVSLTVRARNTNLLPVTYSATGLPSGLAIGATTGVISGTPRAAGTYVVTVTARDVLGVTGSVTFFWTVVAAPACSGQRLVNPGFEPGLSQWYASPGVLHTDRGARTGRRYANLDGFGRTHADSLVRRMAVPAGCNATLLFWLRVKSDDRTGRVHDVLTVYINGVAVKRFSNLNRSVLYHQYRIDLSRYAGRSVVVTWRGVENSSLRTSFQIDDVGLVPSPR